MDAPRPIDATRHPYTISLDRTKELVGRDSSSLRDTRDTFGREFARDPLREIKENSRERERRPKLEITGWARPRLLNNDLSLPNVPGGEGCLLPLL